MQTHNNIILLQIPQVLFLRILKHFKGTLSQYFCLKRTTSATGIQKYSFNIIHLDAHLIKKQENTKRSNMIYFQIYKNCTIFFDICFYKRIFILHASICHI